MLGEYIFIKLYIAVVGGGGVELCFVIIIDLFIISWNLTNFECMNQKKSLSFQMEIILSNRFFETKGVLEYLSNNRHLIKTNVI